MTSASEFPGKHLQVGKDANDKKYIKDLQTGKTDKLTELDGKTSVVIQDAKGTLIFWYLANAIEKHQDITKEFDSIEFKDEKIRGYITHQKLWLADEGFSYTYVGQKNEPTPMPAFYASLRDRVRDLTNRYLPVANTTYPGGLTNKYRSGKDSVGWHQDAEADLKKNAPIAGTSFGVAAKFQFRVPIDNSIIVSLRVQPGSVYWFYSTLPHRVPKDEKRVGVRYNSTFREPRDNKRKRSDSSSADADERPLTRAKQD
jgi:alkylated DNA repair dioxygenase AlkB